MSIRIVVLVLLLAGLAASRLGRDAEPEWSVPDEPLGELRGGSAEAAGAAGAPENEIEVQARPPSASAREAAVRPSLAAPAPPQATARAAAAPERDADDDAAATPER